MKARKKVIKQYNKQKHKQAKMNAGRKQKCMHKRKQAKKQ